MGKLDKDRYLKELSVQFCIAAGHMPFIEVLVSSIADLSDSPEILTDLDVLGLSTSGDGALTRTLFDCKSSGKMSAINRAFWARGVSEYAGCVDAVVLLKNRPIHNHRISALAMGVDLHDENSFVDLGRTLDAAFPQRVLYQSSLDNWDSLTLAYGKYPWADELYGTLRNAAPLTKNPSATFRRVIAEFKSVRGELDPAKKEHVAIYLDSVSTLLALWTPMGRDIRRFFDPKMTKADFEKLLRYYLWGGKESYRIRQRLKEVSPQENGNGAGPIELPAWAQLVGIAGLFVAAPQHLLSSAIICREVALRTLVGSDAVLDANLNRLVEANGRYRQFAAAMCDYGVLAAGLPKALGAAVQKLILSPT